jgi:hypothetical protein
VAHGAVDVGIEKSRIANPYRNFWCLFFIGLMGLDLFVVKKE